MVHPEITNEAMDLIHKINNRSQKMTPIRTVDDVKRTFPKITTTTTNNKENLQSMQNMNNN